MPGSNHLCLIEPLLPAVVLFDGDAPRSRATRCWRPVLRGSSLRLSQALDTTWNRRFSGGTTVPGVPEPGTGSGTLIPMGGWCGSPHRTKREHGRAHPATSSLYWSRELRPPGKQPTPGRERCGELTRGLLMGGPSLLLRDARPGAVPGRASLWLISAGQQGARESAWFKPSLPD